MCAYTELDRHRHDELNDYLVAAGLGHWADAIIGAGPARDDGIIRSRPAFGNNAQARIHGVVARQGDQLVVCNPIWWFDVDRAPSGVILFGQRTSFNARRLHYPLWRDAVKHGRALILATAFGEARKFEGARSKTFHRFVGDSPFFLGGLVKDLGGGEYAGTVITRDAHPAIEPFHDKASPQFVPPDQVEDWLAPDMNDAAAALLANNRITTGFSVTPVKSYASATPTGETRHIPADMDAA